MGLLDIFKNIDLSVIGYMIGELFLGVTYGFVVKYVAKFKASQASNTQIFSANNYCSPNFGTSFPKPTFALFNNSNEFIIVKYIDDEIVTEYFFTFLGESTKVTYHNNQIKSQLQQALWSPIYLFTVVIPFIIPLILGSLVSSLPQLENFFLSLSLSGIAWFFIFLMFRPN